jgi:hypothetical protein
MVIRLVAVLATALVALVAVATAPGRPSVVKPVLIAITVKHGRPVGGVRRPVVKRGRLVRIVVRSDLGSEVHFHGYDLERKVVRGRPTVLQFTARIPGRFELELHRPDVLLAELTVR